MINYENNDVYFSIEIIKDILIKQKNIEDVQLNIENYVYDFNIEVGKLNKNENLYNLSYLFSNFLKSDFINVKIIKHIIKTLLVKVEEKKQKLLIRKKQIDEYKNNNKLLKNQINELKNREYKLIQNIDLNKNDNSLNHLKKNFENEKSKNIENNKKILKNNSFINNINEENKWIKEKLYQKEAENKQLQQNYELHLKDVKEIYEKDKIDLNNKFKQKIKEMKKKIKELYLKYENEKTELNQNNFENLSIIKVKIEEEYENKYNKLQNNNEYKYNELLSINKKLKENIKELIKTNKEILKEQHYWREVSNEYKVKLSHNFNQIYDLKQELNSLKEYKNIKKINYYFEKNNKEINNISNNYLLDKEDFKTKFSFSKNNSKKLDNNAYFNTCYFN